MLRPVLDPFDVAIHNRRGGRNPDQMRIAHHAEPFGHGLLVGADHAAHIVAEDFRRGAWQGAEAIVLEPHQVITGGHAQRLRALPDLEWREGMDVQVRAGRFHRADDAGIGFAGVARVDAALQADFGGAPGHGLAGACRHFAGIDDVGLVAETGLARRLGEGAEGAGVGADVGVVDVAVDDIGDRVAASLAPEAIRHVDHRLRRCAAGGEQGGDFGSGKFVAIGCAIKDFVKRSRHQPSITASQRRTGRSRRRIGHTRAPHAVAGKSLGIAEFQHMRTQLGIDPAVVIARNEFWINGQSLNQRPSGSCANFLEQSDLGPRRLGIDMIERDRRNPAPIVNPRSDQFNQSLAIEIGRGLDGNLVGQHDTRGGNNAQEIVLAGFGRAGHFGARLGAEVLDDDFLQMAMRQMDIAQGQQRFDALAGRLANADQHAAGHRHPRPACRFKRGEADSRSFIRRAIMRPALLEQFLRSAFQHQPGGGRDRAQHQVVGFRQHPGVDMRQQPGLIQHQFGAVADIVDSARKAARVQPILRDGIAPLGRIAEGEQCFLAAGGNTGPGDVEHFLWRQVRR